MKVPSAKLRDTSILAMNGGSSSIKFGVYSTVEPFTKWFYGKLDRIGSNGTRLTFNDLAGGDPPD